MRVALLQMLEDFLSAIVFVLVLALTHQLLWATCLAIAIGVAQFAHAVVTKRATSLMRWMALALAIGLGSMTLITHDSRFIQLKPTIAHVAIGSVMLKRGWLLPYLPPLAQHWLPQPIVIGWGYAWAALMFAMGVANAAAAQWLSVSVWGVFLMGLLLAKLLFGAAQYFVMRRTVMRHMAAATVAAPG